jgi:hypothetical protein
MTDSLDPSFPSFVGGRSFAFWRRHAGVPEPPPPPAAPAPAPREVPELSAGVEPLASAPG